MRTSTLHTSYTITLLLGVIITTIGCQAGMQSKQLEGQQDDKHNVLPKEEDKKQDPKPIEPAFKLSRTSVRLLPFKVRMSKLASATGIDANAPAFETLKSARYELGDFDHARSIRPDLSWNASKMAIWVRGLKPVCAAEAFKQKYPNLPEDLNALILASYGREATEKDLEIVDDILPPDAKLNPAQRHQMICIAVLSSMEFMAQ